MPPLYRSGSIGRPIHTAESGIGGENACVCHYMHYDDFIASE